MEYCEYGCRHPVKYVIRTNRVANPGKTPVEFLVCGIHLPSAVREQFLNARSLADQDMPGTDGITIEEAS